MLAHEPRLPDAQGWQARLDLRFERRPGGDGATVLASCRHFGPLRVQKALHPEGPEICHAIVLHPPAGIVGGDEIDIVIDVGGGARALLTTPGAGKWYRSAPLSTRVCGCRIRNASPMRVTRRARKLPPHVLQIRGVRAGVSSSAGRKCCQSPMNQWRAASDEWPR